MLELILNKASWLAAATASGLLAVIAQAVRLHGSGLPAKTRIAAGYSLLLGIWFAILGTGHLVAVTTGAFLGSLSPHIEMKFVIPFGIALTLPGWLLLASVPGILAGQPGNCKTALATDAFLVLVLLCNAPLVAAFPALGFWLIYRTRKDWGIHLDEGSLDSIRCAVSDAVTTAFTRKEKKNESEGNLQDNASKASDTELRTTGGIMKRIGVFIYGVVSYATFLATFCYAAGFVGNLVVPKSIDSAPQGPLGTALLVNTLLLGLFAVQHSLMARPAFKRRWTRIIPQPAERSTYVLLSNLALILLFWQWRPMGGVVWQVENPSGQAVLYGLFAFGWLLVLASTFLINHFDLFGLRQVYLYLRGREYSALQFGMPGPYKLVRHPLYVGWLLAFWATPTMTAAHLFFAAVTTSYILAAVQLEERDLLAEHGESYGSYRRRVPMLVPFTKRRKASQAAGAEQVA